MPIDCRNSQEANYIADRATKPVLRYGIRRRAEALIQHFHELDCPPGSIVLDIGTADGLVLQRLVDAYGFRGIGLDLSWNHLRAARGRIRCLVQADGRHLPFPEQCIDAIVSTAVLKHVRELDCLLDECHSVLRPRGKLAVIDPTPWGLKLALWLGHLPRESVFQRLDMEDLADLFRCHGFHLLSHHRFMLLPFPGIEWLERTFDRPGLQELFLYQLLCAERAEGRRLTWRNPCPP